MKTENHTQPPFYKKEGTVPPNPHRKHDGLDPDHKDDG